MMMYRRYHQRREEAYRQSREHAEWLSARRLYDEMYDRYEADHRPDASKEWIVILGLAALFFGCLVVGVAVAS